ncbi:MAG TPA: signal peptidase I [Steroidobacteraceae bacterium]|nr:signal peptidase I [Steroidobacteraceae bacterium]
MNIDFTAVLVAVTLLTGALALVSLRAPTRRPLHPALAFARSLFPLVLVVLLIRSFVFEPFRIPSASMMPGLVDGDFIIVNKYAYGLRLPLAHTLLLNLGQPRRGDVIVFRLPADPSIHLIKRLVGLPGDHVQVRDNQVYINGVRMPQSPDGDYSGDLGFHDAPLSLERFGGSAHVLMLAADRFATDFEGTVPAGSYFFMGDNRNDSEDSRFAAVGYVAERYLVGPARWIWLNWRIPGWPDPGRIGMRIR